MRRGAGDGGLGQAGGTEGHFAARQQQARSSLSAQTPSPDLYGCARESVSKESRHPGSVSGTLPGKLLGNDFPGGGRERWPEHPHVILNTTRPAPLGSFSTTERGVDADSPGGSQEALVPNSLWEPCPSPFLLWASVFLSVKWGWMGVWPALPAPTLVAPVKL